MVEADRVHQQETSSLAVAALVQTRLGMAADEVLEKTAQGETDTSAVPMVASCRPRLRVAEGRKQQHDNVTSTFLHFNNQLERCLDWCTDY